MWQINGDDLAQASHETVVDSIRRSGNLVTITVCSAIRGGASVATPVSTGSTAAAAANEYAVAGNNSSRQYSTLPRKLSGTLGKFCSHLKWHSEKNVVQGPFQAAHFMAMDR